ncbi:MAG: PKD domain-containing protein [Thermomicrobiales bacterium]
MSTLTVPVANVAPVVRAFLVPTAPVTHHLALPLEATFTDAGTLDRHTATWDWGDGTTSTALISEANGSITVKGEHQYARGVYALSVTVADESGGVGQSLWRYIVIDDTEHAVAAGSARFTSPAGAVTARPNQAAPAALGFVAAYQAGVTDVRFQVADLDFAGLSYSWVPAPDGQLRLDAMGTVNGAGDYRLELTARDGNLPNGAGDRVRVAIWNRETGALVYDSQPGAASGDAPTTPPDLGEIVIRSLLPVFPRATGSGPMRNPSGCWSANPAAARATGRRAAVRTIEEGPGEGPHAHGSLHPSAERRVASCCSQSPRGNPLPSVAE